MYAHAIHELRVEERQLRSEQPASVRLVLGVDPLPQRYVNVGNLAGGHGAAGAMEDRQADDARKPRSFPIAACTGSDWPSGA